MPIDSLDPMAVLIICAVAMICMVLACFSLYQLFISKALFRLLDKIMRKQEGDKDGE